ncbi:hypothetical protein [Streptomyces sp. V4I2]|uniref:hypothetical protein n=1 Tax=Streptomyces sp. V4I2 TaxID=3042280 RepID=UPI002786A2A4|nr:hypothetical protein [Streptomyces sp. V4I2]MDQ1050688.1 hypothetical protein [Streptomyces sp. V4I2]
MLSTSSRRLTRGTLATLVGVLVLPLLGSAPAGAQQAASGTAPAVSMAELDFLLGEYTCAYTDLTLEEPTTVTLHWDTEKTLKDKFYEMHLSSPDFEGRWVFGENTVDNQYTSFYWDTWGNTGTATSPGWKRGMLRFQGPYITPGGHADSKDEFRVINGDRYTDDAYIRFEGQPWKQISHVDCRRS